MIALVAALFIILRAPQDKEPPIALIPAPAESTPFSSSPADVQPPVIVVTEPSLKPLAKILCDELYLLTGGRPVLSDDFSSGNIVIELNKNIDPAAQSITGDRKVRIRANSYENCARLSAYLLQAMGSDPAGWHIPQFSATLPAAPRYSGLLIDVARNYHSIGTLKEIITLCRLYQVRYLQLHLTDDQAFTFPSAAFPKLTSKNEHGGRAYTIEELRELEQFSRERAVTIIPELEVPGHAAAMIRAMPELFKIAGTKPYEHHATINFANDDVVKAIDTIVGEICDVFVSSPYFHIGGDEADFALADQHSDFQRAFATYQLTGKAQDQIYRAFLNRMNLIVKKNKKQMIVWEGFRRDPNAKIIVDKDITVMGFESAYYAPEHLAADGYNIINAAWTPLYVVNRHAWDPEKILKWDPLAWGHYSEHYSQTVWHLLKSTKRVLGAQMCAWEQPEEAELDSLRTRLPAMMVRICSIEPPREKDFMIAFQRTDEVLARLLQLSVKFNESVLHASDSDQYSTYQFDEPFTLSMVWVSARLRERPGAQLQIHYSLDGRPPNPASPVYKWPIPIRETTSVRAAMFSDDGRQFGGVTSRVYYKLPKK